MRYLTIKSLLIIILVASISCSRETKEQEINMELNAQNYNEESHKEMKKVKVITLGSFHFNFPNLDVNQTGREDQIDVFEQKYQEEIELIVEKLKKFKPTKIVIERQPKYQSKYDSLYTSYINGEHKLTRSEEQQIGFRLAKELGLSSLYCTDSWGTDYEDIKKVINGNDTIANGKFMDYFYNNPDSILKSFHNEKVLFKTEGILAELKKMNSHEYVKKGLGDYLIGIFKYETDENDQFGPDFVTGWWFNRNLRIFRNIQRIKTEPEDRILVIYGAGHMNLLNIFFEASPEYELLDVNDYLK